MKCKYCQAELEDGVTVCSACGKELEAQESAEETTVLEESAEEQVAEEVAAEEEAAAEDEEATAEDEEATAEDEETTAEDEETTAEDEETAAEDEEAAAEDEEAAPEGSADIKEGMKATPGLIAVMAGVIVLLVAILIALVVSGVNNKTTSGEGDADISATDGVTEAAPATIPEDGNPDDVTCKGTYTVTDDDIIAAADDVVATMGDIELTSADLQVYYWMEVFSFLNEYGSYASYFGLDYSEPLDTQICEDGTGRNLTWQQYFLEAALNNWQCYRALALEAEAADFELDETYAEYIEELPAQLESNAADYGVEDALALVQGNVGVGADVEDYLRYMELYYRGYSYFNSLYNEIQPTAEEIEAYFAENEESYAEDGITRDGGKYVDVRHVLLKPVDDEATTGDDGYTIYSDEAWEACRQKAEELYDQWKSGDMSEESFAQLAIDNSEDGNASTGGLYSDVTEGYMVETFNDWCFDASRKSGDHGLVKTQYGYHLMFFVDSRDIWYATAKKDMISEQASEIVPAITDKYPITVDYSAIKLGLVDLTNA